MATSPILEYEIMAPAYIEYDSRVVIVAERVIAFIDAAAGWVQDVHFGGRILGLSGLSKLLVGFGVGVGSTRFHLGEPAARLLVLMVATIVDAVLFGQLAQVFDVQAYELSPLGLIARAVVNGAVGMVVFETMDRQMRRWAPRA